MRIAHFSPLPPQPSGIADYCADLLPHLQAIMDVDVYDNTTLHRFGLRERLSVDACVYHMGNHPAYHSGIWQLLQRFPGTVVLHDVALHAFHQQRSGSHLARELGSERGMAGVFEARRGVETAVSPLVQRIVQVSESVIVHTNTAKKIVTALADTPVHLVPLGVNILTDNKKQITDNRQQSPTPNPRSPIPDPRSLTPNSQFTIHNSQFTIACFGYLAPSKRIEPLLRAVAQIRDSAPPFKLHLIGKVLPQLPLDDLIGELGLEEIVVIEDYLPPDQFEARLAEVDIAVNLRTAPTGGEMSASLVRLLAHGKPVLVSAVDGFLDVPKTAVFHIPQDAEEVDHIADALLKLMVDDDLRGEYGRNAHHYAQTALAFPKVAAQYRALLHAKDPTGFSSH